MQPEKTGDLQEKRDRKGRFRKGVSGNPNGKPSGRISVAAKLKEELARVPQGQKISYLEALVKQILRKAVVEGNESMIKLILNYVDGMPKQSMEIESQEKEERVQILIENARAILDETETDVEKGLVSSQELPYRRIQEENC